MILKWPEHPDKREIIPPFVMAGFITSALFTAVWCVAAAIDGKWIFGWNALSDMGVSVNPASRVIFNYGCVLTGVCGSIFGYGMAKHERGWMFITGVLTMIGPIFLMGVGAIPESLEAPHMVCAGSFGAFGVAAMFTSMIGDWVRGRKDFAAISLVLLAICGLSQLRQVFGFYEAICIICILVWVFVQSFKYYKLIGRVEVDDPLKKAFEDINSRKKTEDAKE